MGLLLAACFAWVAPVQAFWRANPLPSFDRRSGQALPPQAAEANAGQQAAERILRNRLPSVRLEIDPLRRTPTHIRCLDGCLTGPNGIGHGISLQSLEAVPAGESHRPLKVFLQEESPLYGYGPEVLKDLPPSRDLTSRQNGLRTTVWEQRCEGVPVFEAVLISHITSRDELLAVSSSFVPNLEGLTTAFSPDRQGPMDHPAVEVTDAIVLASAALDQPIDPAELRPLDLLPTDDDRRQHFLAPPLTGVVSARLTWLPLSPDEITLAWCVELTRPQGDERYQVLIDSRSGEVLLRRCLTLYLQDATYEVFTSDSPSPFSPGWSSPSDAQPPLLSRQAVTLAAKSTNASPLGWISAGENETRGNNVDAHLDLNADDFPDLPRPQGRPFRVFSPDLDLTRPAEESGDAAVVQLFYWCNFMHDSLYELGFDEAAGNFQKDNFGRGGHGGDPILADAQDGSGVNNANFTPSADGDPGRIQMFVFDGPEPSRDGDLDAEIVLHEYTHGLSTRLVGGGVGLTTLQGGGLGEGWSDFYALALLSQSSDDPDACYAMGAYVTKNFFGLEENYYYGIRRYPYSTDLSKNPLTFKDIDPSQISEHAEVPRNPVFPFSRALASEVHNQGELWCVTLWGARSLLIKKHGFELGNRLMLQLVTDGMKLSPPNPDFIQARDAILQADLVNNGGRNQAELWSAFARRGMGFSAESPVSTTTAGILEAFDLPDSLGVLGPRVLVYTGRQGGPFFTACRSLTLTNHGNTPLEWAAAAEGPEFAIQPPAGILPPHASTTLQTCLTDTALELPTGRYLDRLSITNLTTGILQKRTLDIRVLQFATMPFSDDFEDAALKPEWLVSKPDHGRVELTSLGGPHGGNAHLLLDSDSEGLPARNELTLGLDLSGWTNVVLRFWAREFNDEPNPAPVGLFEDGADFDGVAISSDGRSWVEVQGLQRLTSTNQELVVYLDGPVAQYGLHYGDRFQIRFNQFDNYPVPLDGIAIDDVSVSGTPYRRFALELPAAIREGSMTNDLGSVVLGAPADRDVVFALFSDAPDDVKVSLGTLIRRGESRGTFQIRAKDNSLLDGTRRVQIRAVAIDYHGEPANLSIQDDETASLTLVAPVEVSESDGHLSQPGQIHVSRKADSDLTIDLRTSQPRKLLLPSSVTIRSGETTAQFDITVLDGKEIEGTTEVQILAEVAGWEAGLASIRIRDNDSPTLSLALPPAISEGNRAATAKVLLGGTVRSNVVVELSTSDPANASVPKQVTVEAGKTFATFEIQATDDAVVEGVQTILVRAEAVRFSPASADLVLLDDETPPQLYSPFPSDGATNQPPRLTLRWKPGFGEILVNGDFEAGDLSGWRTASESSQGFVLNRGDVNPDGPDTPGPAYEGDFNALLAQDGPGTHVLWQDVTLPADAKSARLSWYDFIHNHGTEYFDPSQQYRVEIQDLDGKVLEVAFATHPGDPLSTEWTRHEFDLTWYRGRTIRLMFAERDSLGFINVGVDKVSLELGTTGLTEFDVYLGTNSVLGASDWVGTTLTNSYFLSNLPPVQGFYWQVGARRGEALTRSPVWHFETRSIGQLDHFGWEGVSKRLGFGEPARVQITAQDEFGFTVTNYQGQVELRGAAGRLSVDTVLITEIDPGRDDQVELSNVSPGPVEVSGWQVSFYDLSRWPHPKRSLTLPLNTWVQPGRTFTIREGGRAPGIFPDFRLGTNVNWGFLSVGQPVAVMVQDAAGNLVDFVPAVDADPPLIQLPIPVPPTAWSGSPLPAITSQTNTWQRTGNRNHFSGQDWRVAARSFGAINPGLQLPFEPSSPISTTPARAAEFTNGSWNGSLTLSGIGSSVVLWAFDQAGHVGRSMEFSLVASNDLAVQVLAKPTAVFLDQEFLIRYSVTNSGEDPALGTMWSVRIPSSLQLIGNESTQGDWEITGDGAICRLGRLEGNRAATLTIHLKAAQPGQHQVRSQVSSSLAEASLINNELETQIDANLPLLVIADTTVAEGNSGTNLAQFRVRLSAPVRRTVSVHYQTEDDGATAGIDYVESHGTLVFPPGTTNQILLIPVLGDTFYEVQERFIVRLDSPVEALLGDAEARCSISEEETEPRLVVEDVTLVEGSGVTGATARVPVRLTGQNSREVAVTYYTVDGTARSVSDYVSQRGQLLFRLGETQKVVSIPIVSDLRPEPTESFSLVLTNAFGAGISKGEGTITIRDDDSELMSALTWSSWAPTQQVGKPFRVSLTAQDATGKVLPSFAGPVQLRAFASQRESGPTGGSNVWEFPLRSYFHDARSQFLYPAEELGPAGIIRGIKLAVDTIPGQVLENFTLRVKHSATQEFRARDWDNADWKTVLRQDLLVTDPGDLALRFESPFRYDGTNAIAIDLSFDNSSYTTDGLCRFLETPVARGRVFESDSAFGPPLQWQGQLPPAELLNRVPETRFLIDQEIGILPSSTGPFSAGVWTGDITLLEETAGVILEAATAEGILAWSEPFVVVSETTPPLGPRITRLSFRKGDLVVEFLGESDRSYQLERTDGLTSPSWEPVGTPVEGVTSGTVVYDIGGADHPSRFYRIRQLP